MMDKPLDPYISLGLEIVSTRELDRGGRPREEGTTVARRDAQARPKSGVL